MSVHLLNMDPFLKESRETLVESIVITTSVSSFSVCLEFFSEFLHISVSPSDVIPLGVFDVRPLRKLIYLFFLSSEVISSELMYYICLLHMMRFLE